jgi:hypothetical protein
MIIWTERQYQAFLKKAGIQEPTSEKVETQPTTPVAPIEPIMHVAPVRNKSFAEHVGKMLRVGLAGLTMMGLGAALHSELSSTSSPAMAATAAAQPVKVAHHAHIKKHRPRKKHHSIKKHVDKPVKTVIKPDIEEIESRVTTLEERMDAHGL